MMLASVLGHGAQSLAACCAEQQAAVPLSTEAVCGEPTLPCEVFDGGSVDVERLGILEKGRRPPRLLRSQPCPSSNGERL